MLLLFKAGTQSHIKATYRVPNDNKLYCSTCAIGEMNKGVNVIRIELKDQIFYKEFYSKFDKENT